MVQTATPGWEVAAAAKVAAEVQAAAAGTNAARLPREAADKNTQAGGDTIGARDLMGDDGPSTAREAFKALHHPERKATERLLIRDGLRKAAHRKCANMGTC